MSSKAQRVRQRIAEIHLSEGRPTLTPTLARAAGEDAANTQMRKAGSDGKFRMVPSGDIVDYEERCRRLKK